MKLFIEYDDGTYQYNKDASNIRYKFAKIVKNFIIDHGQYSLVDLRVLLADVINDAVVHESTYRRLTVPSLDRLTKRR